MSGRIAGITICALLLAGCAGRPGSFTPLSPNAAAFSRHVEAAHDVGRRAAAKTASVVVLMKYRDQGGLDRLTARLARSQSSHYLTRQEFLVHYAPTPQQEQIVLDGLRRAGFTIDRRYGNRTIIDASAPVRTVERFFNTQIHDFRQAGHGVRFASVKPVVVPNRLASLVAAVTIDTVVRMRVVYDEDPPALPDSLPVPDEAAPAEPDVATGNVVKNPGFESGHLAPWQACHTGTVAPGKITKTAHAGKYAASTGSTKSPEVNGISCVWQPVKIPAQGLLTAFLFRSTSDTNRKNASQFIALYSAQGKFVASLLTSLVNSKKWSKVALHLGKYAGQTDYIAFGVIGSKKDPKKYVAMSVDDVSLTGVVTTPSPSPSPSPTSSPSPGPTDSPCAGGTPPAANYGPNGGWGPAATVAGVLLPSIYCYNGAGETAAIVIDAIPPSADIEAYMQFYGITRHGSITSVKIDGGDTNPSADSYGDATLDLETIASLAPNANVIVYEPPSLNDSAIIDAYNQVLADGKASVVNSSFSGCDTGDSTFVTTTNAIAQQGAAEGVTFAGSSGDQGVECYSNGSFIVGTGSPGSDPYFVSVGGTQSSSSAVAYDCGVSQTAMANPVVWNDCVGAGGGGISTVWPLPSYQSSLTVSGRSVPDASMPAAGIDTYSASEGWGTVWGTSWASPLYVAMQLEVNEECGAHLWGISSLYGSLSKDPTYQYAFVDVTSGDDSYDGHTGYTAKSGFDTASGIGIPMGVNIALYSCGGSAVRRAGLVRPHR
jgi:hypothetical protein